LSFTAEPSEGRTSAVNGVLAGTPSCPQHQRDKDLGRERFRALDEHKRTRGIGGSACRFWDRI
jgi:hypothetical protein